MYDGYIDGLYEREKRILCILGAVCAAASGIFIAPPSKFYGVYFGSKSGLLVIFAAIMSFLYAAVFLIISGTAKRGRRLLSLEEAAKNTTHSSGYVSVYAMSRDSGASSSYKRRCKAANTAAVALILLTSVLMIILFTAGDVSYLLSEITKKPIDRTVSDFRIWADTFGKFIVFLALAMTLTAAPDVMRNRRVNKICYMRIFLYV